jgi:hypothetical protein
MLARARKHQYAAFIRDEGVLCVWSDNVKGILQEAESLEELLLDYVWSQSSRRDKSGRPVSCRADANRGDYVEESPPESTPEEQVEDPETVRIKQERRARPLMLYEAILVGLSIIVVCGLCGLGYSTSGRTCQRIGQLYLNCLFPPLGTLIKGYLLDGSPVRFALVAVTPFMVTLTLVSSKVRDGQVERYPHAFLFGL